MLTRCPALRSLVARSLAATMMLGAVGLFATPALAQPEVDPNQLVAPVPAPPRNPPSHLMGIAAGLLLGCLVVGVNFIPSKRGHQD